jgi:hypothetical protein
MMTLWPRLWRIGMAFLGALAAAVLTFDQIDYPSGWWTDSHGHQRHTGLVIAAIATIAVAAIVANAGQEFSESRKEKSLAQRVKIEQLLGAILTNIVEYSMEQFEKSLKDIESQLGSQTPSNDLRSRFHNLLEERRPSITKMAAYYYELRKRPWRTRLVRRARFSIGTDRPERLLPRYKLGETSIGTAGEKKEDTWERIVISSASALITNTPLFKNGVLIGVLSIVAEPGDKVTEDRLLDQGMTDRLAGWRTALTNVVEGASG